MKIVHLTTHISGGAGSLAYNIYKAGVRKKEETNLLISIETLKLDFISRIYASIIYRLHDVIYLILGLLNIIDCKYFFFSLFPSFVFKNKFEDEISDVDVFFVYWISRFYDSNALKELKIKNPNAKFIFFNTDEAPFTGGCHYKFDCTNHEKSCLKCPGVNSDLIQNKIANEFQSKIDLYRFINPKFILPSSTYYSEFQNSELLKKFSFIVKPYGAYFNKELKKFTERRKSFLLDNKTKINLLIRSSSEPRKGCQLFIETIKKLSNDNSPLLDRMVLHIIGDNYLIKSGISELIHTQFYGIVNRERLFELYAESDVFIVTSEQDSGPIMINECTGLGLFVLSTKVGVASDLILGKNGVIYDRNTKSLIEALKNLNLDRIREFAREHLNSEDLYDLSFEKFYKEIINNIP